MDDAGCCAIQCLSAGARSPGETAAGSACDLEANVAHGSFTGVADGEAQGQACLTDRLGRKYELRRVQAEFGRRKAGTGKGNGLGSKCVRDAERPGDAAG